MCIHKPLKCKKTCYEMIFQPEYAEDISSVYFLNQIFESGFDLFAKKCQKGYDPYQYCLCAISSCSIDKQIAH